MTQIAESLLHERQILTYLNTLRLRQDGRHFPGDIFKCTFLNEAVQISIQISLKFVPKGPINNIPALAQIMAWRQPGAEPLSEPMMVIYWCIYASLSLNELNNQYHNIILIKVIPMRNNPAFFLIKFTHFRIKYFSPVENCTRLISSTILLI